MHVLICDDSSFARAQLRRALPVDWGAHLYFATNGLEAIELALAQPLDLIFLDLTMPVMDGYGVLETLASKGLMTKVIVVSGDIQSEAYQRVMALGALDFLQKPATAGQIAALLNNHKLLTLRHCGHLDPDAARITVEIRDVYQELANVAMGQAADLLARMLDVFVVLPVPVVNELEVQELQMALSAVADNSELSAVCQGFIGAGIAGEALLMFQDSNYPALAALMKHPDALTPSVELELLMDTASILIGAFLRGFSEQLDTPFSQGHPVVLGLHRKVHDLIAANKHRWRRTLAIEIHYQLQGVDVECDLLLLFTEDSIASMNKKIMYML